MAEHNDLGQKGEELARLHLKKKGYDIVKTNWHFGKDEIDIIARHDDTLVFVEVKTRRSSDFGSPETFVTKKKQSFMVRAANSYFDRYKIDLEGRFDVISVVLSPTQCRINHIERAFYPTL